VRLSHDHHIDVVTGPFEENVAHIAAHDIAFQAEAVGCFTDLMEYLLV
jgi:hypothetical protein